MKKWLGVVLLTLLLVVMGLSVLLVQAHLQVRSVNTTIPTRADFAKLKRPDGPTKLYYITTAQQQLPQGILSHSTFVFEWEDGKLFVLDTGMREPVAVEFGTPLELFLGGEASVPNGTVAGLMGDAVSRVKGVGFTHLHIDHTDGLSTLCENNQMRAGLLQTIQQRDEHNFNTRESAQNLQESCLTALELADGPVFENTQFPGLGLVPVGGHTPGSTLFASWLGDTLYLFSGDTTNSKQEMLDDVGKGWVYSTLLVPEDTTRTGNLRRWLTALSRQEDVTVVVSHDLADIENSGLAEFTP